MSASPQPVRVETRERFAATLERGLAGESAITRWMVSRGYSVLPAYETILNTGKGPRLVQARPAGNSWRAVTRIAPDLLVFRCRRVMWVEAKTKSAFTWHRKSRRWVTGIDLTHYLDYLRVDDETPWPVWLMFLQLGGQAKDSPGDSPAGLYGDRLAVLRDCENHRHENGGRAGMVYWAVESLRKFAELAEVLPDEPEAACASAWEGRPAVQASLFADGSAP